MLIPLKRNGPQFQQSIKMGFMGWRIYFRRSFLLLVIPDSAGPEIERHKKSDCQRPYRW